MMLSEAGRNPPGKNGVSRLPAGTPGCGFAVVHGALVRLGAGLAYGLGLVHGAGLALGILVLRASVLSLTRPHACSLRPHARSHPRFNSAAE
jgi:hypothetical protein